VYENGRSTASLPRRPAFFFWPPATQKTFFHRVLTHQNQQKNLFHNVEKTSIFNAKSFAERERA
jgi:hypothetical protein